jgi:hypothetical protein
MLLRVYQDKKQECETELKKSLDLFLVKELIFKVAQYAISRPEEFFEEYLFSTWVTSEFGCALCFQRDIWNGWIIVENALDFRMVDIFQLDFCYLTKLLRVNHLLIYRLLEKVKAMLTLSTSNVY